MHACMRAKSLQSDPWDSSCSLPGDLPNPGIKPTSLKSPALTGRFFTTIVLEKLNYRETKPVNSFQLLKLGL